MPDAESRTRATAIAATILHPFWCSSLGSPACCHAFRMFRPCLGSSPETVARRPVGVPGAVLKCGTARSRQAAADRQPVIACEAYAEDKANGLQAARQAQAKVCPLPSCPFPGFHASGSAAHHGAMLRTV